MKQIIARLYITIITVFILLGIAFLFNEIRVSRNDLKYESSKVSKEVNKLIENNWFKNKNLTNQSLNDDLEKFMNKTPNLNSIIIYSKDEGLKVISSRFLDRSFLLNSFEPGDPNWNGGPEYSFNTWGKIENFKITTPLTIDKTGYSVDIIYNILPRETIQEDLWDAIVVSGILFILTVIVMILFSIWKNRYSVKEYDDELFKPMGTADRAEEGTPSEDLDDLADIEGFDFEDSEAIEDKGLSDSALDDLDMDFEGSDSLDGLDDFDLDSGNLGDAEADDLEDFSIGFNEREETESADSLDELEDFDLEIEEPAESEDTGDLDDLEDFSLDFEEKADSEQGLEELDELEDFDLEMEDTADSEDAGELDDLEDFSLDFEEETDSEQSLDEIEEPAEDTTELNIEEIDELEDFDLELEEPAEDTTEQDIEDIDELEDFDLEIEEPAEDTTEQNIEEIDELADFDLEIEEPAEDTTEQNIEDIDELEDFDLEIEETAEDTTEQNIEDIDELADFDLELEETEETEDFPELEDLAADIDVSDEDAEEQLESIASDLESIELEDLSEDMDISPESIEASAETDQLPEMNIEEEAPSHKSDFKSREEAGPEFSSLLEKAGVSGNDLSIAVFELNSTNLEEHYNFIAENFEDNNNIFEIENNKIAVALNNMDNNQAITEINELLSSAKDKGLDITAGISSMNGRLVGENRLMGEAISALEKAKDQEKEMLAFRPDPSKYEDFIKNS